MDVVEIIAAAALSACSYYNFLHLSHSKKIKQPNKRRWWIDYNKNT
jgi:hypothetical protein